eukprot:2516003-Pleurochrysis_carterae.AAC.1
MWLVSHGAHLVACEVESAPLRALLKWEEPPRPAVVCSQLVALGLNFDTLPSIGDEELLTECLHPAYSQLSGLVGSADFAGVEAVLRSRPT